MINSRIPPIGRRALRMAPFGAAMAIALALPLLPPGAENGEALAAAIALSALIAVASLLLPWRRLPAWTEMLPALAYLGVVALLREAGGGEESPYSPLVLLPVLWLALYGTPLMFAASVAGVAAVFLGPILVAGPPAYPDTEVSRAALWVAVATMVGLAVRTLHRERGVASKNARDDADSIQAVLEATRTLSRSTDHDAASQAICSAALRVSGADVAILYEPSADGRALVRAAVEGEGADELRGVRIPFVGESSGATKAFISRRPYWVAEARDADEISERLLQSSRARSLYFQPVLRDGSSVGVLAIIWRHPQPPQLAGRVTSMIDLLAAEAAVAIERAGLLARLEAVARTDDLTGLANRRSWAEELPRELARALRNSQALCVAMVDLDRFKRFNDELGHQAGDRLLKEAAASWRAELRATDTLARYGGEEFAVLLPACDPRQAVSLLERLRAATPGGQTCSAGVASWDGAENADSLVARADAALYEAKSAGRDRVVSAS
jgi:diguanylate cyclase (GGDEF)-like protein